MTELDARAPADAWRDARNVLAVRVDTIGDVLMTTPAIRAIRDRGRRHVTLLTSSIGAAAGELVPEVDELIVYDAPWMKGTSAGDAATDLETIRSLRERGFDAAVIFTVYSQNPLPAALLCYLAGIPLRLAHCREKAYGLLTDRVPEPEPERLVRHEVRRQLDLVGAVGYRTDGERLSLRVGEDARVRVAELIGELRLDEAGGRWAVLHPGASAPSRRYPPDLFAAAADELALEHGWRIVLSGSASDRDITDRVRGAMRARPSSLVGRLSLEELGALLERAPLLIANNSGPVHVAAAVGTPVVDLYAMTNPQHTPWGVPSRVLFHDVPCRWCYASVCPEGHHACLRRVEPAEVVNAALEVVAEREALAGSARR